MRLETGAQIGPYRIDSLLGAGGMGEVYSAYDPRLHRNVAIKLLSNRAASDEQVRRFQQEARAAGILNHPNILTVHEIGGERGSLYIVSELLQGSTLRTTLNKEHRLSIRRTVEYGVQIARGLDAAHAAGIVHRDLKPENVFLMRDGRVKILDFGIAKLHVAEPVLTGPNDTTRSVGLTVPGMIVGTVPYMSPEQVNGDEIDRRSDIFSFGIVLYEMLCGRQPFHGSSPHDTIHAILHDDPQSPSSIRPDVPAGLEAIVLSCLAKSPSERFQSAADLAIALQAVTMPTQTGPLPAPPPRRSRPRAVAAITAAGVVITAIAIAAAVPRRQDGAPRRCHLR
jgi:serine/threonine protein kinase